MTMKTIASSFFARTAFLSAILLLTALPGLAQSSQATSATLSITPAGSLVAGEAYTLSVAVDPTAGNGIVTGQVWFQISTPDGSESVESVSLANGVARYSGVLPGGSSDYSRGAGVFNVGFAYAGSPAYEQTEMAFQNVAVSASGFSLSATPVTLSNAMGTTVIEPFPITPYESFNAPITLSATGLPTGMSLHWMDNPVPADIGSVSLQIVAYQAGVVPGTYNVTITGTSGNFSTSSNLLLTVLPSTSATVAIRADGPAEGAFTAENDCIGGGSSYIGNQVDMNGMASGVAPAALFQSQRAGIFSCAVPGLVAGSQHSVAIFFDEFYFSAPFERMFDVSINGTQVLNNFDMFATAGKNVAFVEAFPATANSNGQIVVGFTSGQIDQPSVAGIEVW